MEQLNLLKLYDAEIRKAIDSYGGTSSKQFKKENEAIVSNLLSNVRESLIDELNVRFQAHLCYLDEQNEQCKYQDLNSDKDGIIGMLITSRWVWLAVHTKKFGDRLMSVESYKGKTNGFPPIIALAKDNSFCYGYGVNKLRKIEYQGSLISFICSSHSPDLTARQMPRKFFASIKTDMEMAFEDQDFSQILLIISSCLELEDRNFLRKACYESGFEKVFMLTESSVIAHQALQKLYFADCILVVILVADGVRMEIYEQIDGIQLLAVASDVWTRTKQGTALSKKTEKKPLLGKLKLGITSDAVPQTLIKTVADTYKKVLAQIEIIPNRKLAQQYILLSVNNNWVEPLDSFFQEQSLTRAETLRNDEAFLDVFSLFSVNNQLRESFQDTLSTVPTK